MGETESLLSTVGHEADEPASINIDDPEFMDSSRKDSSGWYRIGEEVGGRVVKFLESANKKKLTHIDRGYFSDAGQVSKFASDGDNGANIEVTTLRNHDGSVVKAKLTLREQRSQGYLPEVFLTGEALAWFKDFVNNQGEEDKN